MVGLYFGFWEQPKGEKSTLIYGAGEAGKTFIKLAIHEQNKVLGFLDDSVDKQGRVVLSKPIWSSSMLSDSEFSRKVTDVLLAMPSISPTSRHRIIEKLSEKNIRVKTIPSYREILWQYGSK